MAHNHNVQYKTAPDSPSDIASSIYSRLKSATHIIGLDKYFRFRFLPSRSLFAFAFALPITQSQYFQQFYFLRMPTFFTMSAAHLSPAVRRGESGNPIYLNGKYRLYDKVS